MSEWRGIGDVVTVSDHATAPAKRVGFDLLTLGSAFVTFVLTFELVRRAFSAGLSSQPPTSLMSVPRIDWRSEPPASTINPNYRPCYSGSGDCMGG